MSSHEKFLTVSQGLAILAVPMLVAYFGASIQREISQGQLKKEYVQLAIDVLKQPTNDNEMKLWAQRLLAENSPTPFKQSELLGLIGGMPLVIDIPCPSKTFMVDQEDLTKYLDRIVSVESATPSVGQQSSGKSKAVDSVYLDLPPDAVDAYVNLKGGLAEQRITISYLKDYAKVVCGEARQTSSANP